MMRSVRLLLPLMLLWTIAATAQEPTTPKTRAGDRAFLFTLNGLANFGAGAFAGGIGGQYYFIDNVALRIGLGLDLESSTMPPPDSTGQRVAADSSSTGFTLMPAVRYNIGSSGPVVGYAGAQLLIRSTTSTVDNVNFIEGVTASESSLTFGGGLIAGAEWFPFSNVSLSAEYQLMFTSTSGTRSLAIEGKSVDATIPPRRILSLGPASGANFLLALYF